MDSQTKQILRDLADRYETADFINGDPSWFMHKVEGRRNQETIGFIASVLSYGRRDIFMPKVNALLENSNGEPYQWIRDGKYKDIIPDNTACFYRLYNNKMMLALLNGVQQMIVDYGSIGEYVKHETPSHNALDALKAIAVYFQQRNIKGMVPAPLSSAAKRPCMFLRWMVRDASPVDIGVWADFIDKRTLYIPLDTHVLQEAHSLGLVSGKTAGWGTVAKLTDAMREVFPDDPAKGDFALFGYGVNKDNG